jgi:hypothetical protein
LIREQAGALHRRWCGAVVPPTVNYPVSDRLMVHC